MEFMLVNVQTRGQSDGSVCWQENNTGAEKESSSEPEEESSSEDESQVGQGGGSWYSQQKVNVTPPLLFIMLVSTH